jgi:pimeloyl-ACP methyl ester carboxylesterase
VHRQANQSESKEVQVSDPQNSAGPGGSYRLNVGAGAQARDIAVIAAPGSAPGIVWLAGFKSDMVSTKASAVADWASSRQRACLRFDYTGHGASGGRFEDGTIGLWLEDSLAAVRAHGAERLILVGSSMGGWIALLLARALAEQGEAERLAGMVLVAPAVDFTESLMWNRFSPEIRHEIETAGVWHRPSDYSSEPYAITRKLIEEGRVHLLLEATIRTFCPVHILQGMQDTDVPWQHAMKLVEHLAGDGVTLTLVKDGDHRLSRQEDIARLITAIETLA